jgi:hypothetical protein
MNCSIRKGKKVKGVKIEVRNINSKIKMKIKILNKKGGN